MFGRRGIFGAAKLRSIFRVVCRRGRSRAVLGKQNRLQISLLASKLDLSYRIAIAIAKQQGIKVAVTDFGHLRPDWVILELDGMETPKAAPT
jgi:capsule polysaccharide modification protein KpsS